MCTVGIAARKSACTLREALAESSTRAATGSPNVGERNVTEYAPGGSLSPRTGVLSVCDSLPPTTVTTAGGSAVSRSWALAASALGEGLLARRAATLGATFGAGT